MTLSTHQHISIHEPKNGLIKTKGHGLTISILIPCHNEEKTIGKTLEACFRQTRLADEIVVVNDGSTDNTAEVLQMFSDRIKIVTVSEKTGNKSKAQEIGLRYVQGNVFIALDGDTLLHPSFVTRVEKYFFHSEAVAFAGYIESLQYNWITACRAIDYFLGQVIYKRAQSDLGFLFVIPGCAGAFRTSTFRDLIRFEHDTLTEDLDFTYKFHEAGIPIHFDARAIVYTQDPPTLQSYINQMRRWYGGGWQNFIKHVSVIQNPKAALILSLMYIEGLFSASLLFLLPFISLIATLYVLFAYISFSFFLGLVTAFALKRKDTILASFSYPLFTIINAWVFLEQFFLEVILRKKEMVWFHPERTSIL